MQDIPTWGTRLRRGAGRLRAGTTHRDLVEAKCRNAESYSARGAWNSLFEYLSHLHSRVSSSAQEHQLPSQPSLFTQAPLPHHPHHAPLHTIPLTNPEPIKEHLFHHSWRQCSLSPLHPPMPRPKHQEPPFPAQALPHPPGQTAVPSGRFFLWFPHGRVALPQLLLFSGRT